jgi:hypothetical protein
MELSSAADHSTSVEVVVHNKLEVKDNLPGDCSNDLLGSISNPQLLKDSCPILQILNHEG